VQNRESKKWVGSPRGPKLQVRKRSLQRIQVLPQRRRDAEQGILEAPGILPSCSAALHEFIRPICEYVGLTSFSGNFEKDRIAEGGDRKAAAEPRIEKMGRLAERTQTSGANAPSPPTQILPQRRRDAEQWILEEPGPRIRRSA
jgi:hypothetical protein